VTAAAGTLTGTTLASNVVSSSLTSVGTLTNLTVTNTITGSVSGSSGSTTGNAATATALQTARNINGVSFNGTADITVTAAAGTLSGNTLASGVTASSLTSVGTLTSLTVTGGILSSAFLEVRSDTAGIFWENAANNRYYHTALSGSASSPSLTTSYFDGTNVLTRTTLDASGNLAVDTNTLFVDAVNNRVGVLTATPGEALEVNGALKLGSGSASVSIFTNTGWRHTGAGTLFVDIASASAAQSLVIRNSSSFTTQLTLDASGNLGLGVTPSAWSASNKVFQSTAASLWSDSTIDSGFSNNAFYDGAQWVYRNNGPASNFWQRGTGGFAFQLASSGTAGNAITFTTAMTLDASGNLLVGKTSPTYSASNRSVFEINNTDSSIIALQYGGANGYYLQANSTAAYLWNSANTPWIVATNNTERARITAAGSVVAGGSVALATTATDGFLYVPTCAGTPTGTPTAITGMAPIVVNTTNNKLYFYSGGAWRDAGP
jgi:hypothetical protein